MTTKLLDMTYDLQVKTFTKDDINALTSETFFSQFSQQSVFGDLDVPTLDAVFERIKGFDVINGLFDYELSFGMDVSAFVPLESELVTAYMYTAYEQLFKTVIEPYIGSGEVFAVIHGGRQDGDTDVMLPFMQIVFKIDYATVYDTTTHTWSDDYIEWFDGLKGRIVAYSEETYPDYVAPEQQMVQLETFDRMFEMLPLDVLKDMLKDVDVI